MSPPRCIRLVLLALLVNGCTPRTAARATDAAERAASLREGGTTDLIGAWRLVETAVRAPGAGWDRRPAPQGGLFVFTQRHYSYFYVPGATPRPRFADANRPTDAERAATFATFIAGAGRYTFDGRTAVLRADFRKNPNEMDGTEWRWNAEQASDTLLLMFRDPPFLPGLEWRIALVRVE
jgi:hypothetical protein